MIYDPRNNRIDWGGGGGGGGGGKGTNLISPSMVLFPIGSAY